MRPNVARDGALSDVVESGGYLCDATRAMLLTPPPRSQMPDPSVALMIISIGVQALGLIWKSSTRRAFKAAVTTVVSVMPGDTDEGTAWSATDPSSAAGDAAKARAYWLALMAKFPD